MRLARTIAALALALLGACQPNGAASPDAAMVAKASAEARLRGAWKLRDFRPEKPLDPMSAAFVQFQCGNLVVRFDRGRFVAESPGVHVDRAFQIIQADGDQFRAVSYDDQGVAYDAAGTFVQADTLQINSWSEPWRGVATLSRMTPWENVLGPLPPP
jgi:hypothetical protein